jgi:hypothetical protein
MKQVFKSLCPALLSCLLIISCSKSNITPDTAATASDNPSPNLVSGNRIISSYTQRGEDKTSSFSGFVFTFSADGKLTATQGGSTTSGTWSYSPSSVGYYGGVPTKSSISINLGVSKTIKNLTRTWNVLSNDATNLSLISPEPAEDEHLVFTKQ